MRLATLALLLALAAPVLAQNTGHLTGRVTDAHTGETLVGATVFLPEIQRGAVTNQDGNYLIGGVPVGVYVVEVSFADRETRTVRDVDVSSGRTRTVDVALYECPGPCANAHCVEEPLVPTSVYSPIRFVVEASRDPCCRPGIALDHLPTGR